MTFPKRTAGFSRGAAVSRAGEGCVPASELRHAVKVGAARAASSAARRAARG
ncbi:hypothetical protein [Sorangium sp. So ce1097]|uniref:hypothetical protein n=1 Tax=Sorangium sp. So ce1097 TaxID=3133330 RepID=UPI003F62466F